MKYFVICLVFCGLTPLMAGGPEGIAHWTSAQLKGYEKKLAQKLNEQKAALEELGTFGNHSFLIAHREGSGQAEWHEKQADVFFVQTGEATLVVGGKVENGKTTAPGEIRGASIQGGERKKLGPGDIVHIPAKTAHQVLLDGGKQLTYAVVKIDSP